MRECKHCKIEVGGDLKVCPLCRSKLTGDKEEAYFPVPRKLKRLPLLFKIALFILLSACAVFVELDLTYKEKGSIHPSLPVLLWVVCILIMVRHFIKCHRNIPSIIFQVTLMVSVLTELTSIYIGFEDISSDYIIPILLCVSLTVNFIFCLIKAHFTENAIIYMLLNIIIGICAYISTIIHKGNPPVAWTMCLQLSVISFIGLIIFKGRTVISEIQKRLHM